VIKDICQTIEPMVQEKGLELEVDVSGDVPDLRTDRTRLKQVLLNLLSNAVKFTDEGKVALRVTTTSGSERVRIEVEDTGIGMAEEHLSDIFDDFRQVDQSSTRRFGGTGLGLSITRKLVGLMQGDIEVESEPGEGSTFMVEFPARIEQPGDLEQLGMEPVPAEGSAQ
jgi:signal transduction histidine kinase